MDWLDLLAVQGTLKSLLQHHSSKASILRCSAFFTVQLSHPYVTTGQTIALTRWTFVVKVMSLLFNMLSRFVIALQPNSGNDSNSTQESWVWMPSPCPELRTRQPLPPWRQKQGAMETASFTFHLSPTWLRITKSGMSINTQVLVIDIFFTYCACFLLKSNTTCGQMASLFTDYVTWGKLFKVCEPQCLLCEMGQ